MSCRSFYSKNINYEIKLKIPYAKKQCYCQGGSITKLHFGGSLSNGNLFILHNNYQTCSLNDHNVSGEPPLLHTFLWCTLFLNTIFSSLTILWYTLYDKHKNYDILNQKVPLVYNNCIDDHILGQTVRWFTKTT